MWDYFFPESRTMNWGVINIYIVWRPMSLSESGTWKSWESGVANQHDAKCVRCAWMTIWGLEESEWYGNWMRWVLTVNSYAIWGNMAWHLSKLIHKVFLKAIECVAVCWSRGFKIVWGKYKWREKKLWMHVVHTKSSKYFLFKLREILKYGVFMHYVMGQIMIIICVHSCCNEEPVKWRKISYGSSIEVSEYKYGCMCEFLSDVTMNTSMSVGLCKQQLHGPQNIHYVWAKMAVINSSGQWNYMGEVSRLLIASPRQGLMETFFFVCFFLLTTFSNFPIF